MKPRSDISDPRIIKAVTHPLRIRILAALDERTATPSELARELGAPLGNVSYHVRQLAGLGLIKLVKRTPRRGAVEHHYKAVGRPRIADDPSPGTAASVEDVGVEGALDYRALRGAADPVTAVIEKLTPDVQPRVISVNALLQARRNAELRAEFLTQLEHLTSSQVAELAGSTAANRSALAHRWRTEGKIFGVEWRDQWLFPRFQFDDVSGKPKPEIAAALTPFRLAGSSDWEVAAWFTGRNPWLRTRPIDVLPRAPDRVVHAAERSLDSPT
jgi:DNA-binding transcriptional ArsR family regulator